MSKPTATLTDRDIAERLHIHWEQVQRRCKSGEWPHIRVGRFYRFDEEHYAAIKRLHEVTPAQPAEDDGWGVKTRAS